MRIWMEKMQESVRAAAACRPFQDVWAEFRPSQHGEIKDSMSMNASLMSLLSPLVEIASLFHAVV
jgi:hypothetical protein